MAALLQAVPARAVDREHAAPDPRITNGVHIASGELMGAKSNRGFGQAIYRISEVLRGSFPTNPIGVIYYTRSVTESLPSPALLILVRGERPDAYKAIGFDAGRCMLPDTPERRHALARADVADLIATPTNRWLPRDAAISLAEEAYDAEGTRSHETERAQRYEFGWKITIAPTDGASDSDVTYVIGDDGLLKMIFPAE